MVPVGRLVDLDLLVALLAQRLKSAKQGLFPFVCRLGLLQYGMQMTCRKRLPQQLLPRLMDGGNLCVEFVDLPLEPCDLQVEQLQYSFFSLFDTLSHLQNSREWKLERHWLEIPWCG